jgi:DNA-binding transcriptional MocR family regulator
VIDRIVSHLNDRSAAGIARAVARLASSGQSVPGERLPTVRGFADRIGVSPATVGEAWRTLAAHGIVETQGRRGTFLKDTTAHEPVRHFRHVQGTDLPLDVSTGYPDPALLPDLAPLLAQVARGKAFPGYPQAALDPELGALLRRPVLPFDPMPKGVALATDAISAMIELLPVLGRFGDRMVVGDAEFAPYLDLLDRYGITAVPVPFDDQGPSAEAVEAAVEAGARAVLLQPRVHNPTGAVTSPERLRRLAELCRTRDTFVIECEYFGGLASSPPLSAAVWAPEQTIYIRSFAKDLHPDVRVCVVAGPPRVVQTLHQRRVGGRWLSRINQDLLRLLLRSPEVAECTARAKAEYDRRREVFVTALAEHGIEVPSRDGFNVWVPVQSEQGALVYLATHGISAAPGSAFQTDRTAAPHLRVSVAGIDGDVAAVAATIAQAARTLHTGHGSVSE